MKIAALGPMRRRKTVRPVDRMARLRKMFPHGPVKGDIQSVIDYERETPE